MCHRRQFSDVIRLLPVDDDTRACEEIDDPLCQYPRRPPLSFVSLLFFLLVAPWSSMFIGLVVLLKKTGCRKGNDVEVVAEITYVVNLCLMHVVCSLKKVSVAA